MSVSSRHHIPFPLAFLSLNPTPKKPNNVNSSSSISGAAASEPELAAHGFLSNRPSAGARHSSISSVSSVDSVASTAPALQASAAASPVLAPQVAAFLALNSKYAAPPSSATEMIGDKTGFLSNRA